MTTVFIGGSRHVSRLNALIRDRLNTIVEKHHHVVVGDANGADKAVQKHFADAAYDAVTVYCSGGMPRNRLADWNTRSITPPTGAKGFQFYAAKDRQMAADADVGLMIWDGKSPGTVLNVLRLVQAGKIAVLLNVPEKTSQNIKSFKHWQDFLTTCSPELQSDLRARATRDEWEFSRPNPQFGLSLDVEDAQKSDADAQSQTFASSETDSTDLINAALVAGDVASFVDKLGKVARSYGMSKVASDTGLSRESLYRSFASDGNPEFSTIVKVMHSLGLQLGATNTQH
jgi:adenine-specific DNA-methyltransferase